MIQSERLLERFLQYVAVDTTAVEGVAKYPSSDGQLELGRIVVEELRALGLAEVEQDRHGLVYATVPASSGYEASPTVALNSHFDTSPETTGANVRPQVIRNYAGGDLVLPGDTTRVIRVADSPELDLLIGKTLITTDGTTLLGGDDKAGLAVIVEMACCLLENPALPRPAIKLLFTCDEEIGRGVAHVDVARLGAAAGYTLDGGGAGVIDVETFSADLAIVRVRGVNIHPSIGKGRLVNSLRAASWLLTRLPREVSPEQTADREGFLHPYHVEGGVAETTIRVLLRDFDAAQLERFAGLLRSAAAATRREWPGTTVDVDVQPQYRNMGEGLRREPRAVDYARQAYRRLGRSFREEIIRGGTDGSQLTALGLPTPNLSTGQHNLHSPLEWACLEEMVEAAELLCELMQVWAEDPGPS